MPDKNLAGLIDDFLRPITRSLSIKRRMAISIIIWVVWFGFVMWVFAPIYPKNYDPDREYGLAFDLRRLVMMVIVFVYWWPVYRWLERSDAADESDKAETRRLEDG
jgi:hypothetical protein